MATSLKDMLAEAKGEVETLSPDDAQAGIVQGALLVDVRENPEFEGGLEAWREAGKPVET